MENNSKFKRYVLTFTKTGDTLRVYDLACSLFSDVVMFPVPSKISNSCGLAISIKNVPYNEQERFFERLNVSVFLYEMNMYSDEVGTNHIIDAKLVKKRMYSSFPLQ